MNLSLIESNQLYSFKYADPVADLLDKWGVFRARLFRESCVYYRGNYVKVCVKPDFLTSIKCLLKIIFVIICL